MIIGSRIIFHENLSSTNTLAASMLKRGGVPEGTVIRTGYQSAGRGQGTNSWESQPGKNLLFSIILYPLTVKAEKQFIISKAVSLGISDFLSVKTSPVSVKWPNDIYAGSDKIAGILIENSLIGNDIESTIAGIGMNINQERFTSGAPNPVSLKMITGTDYNLDDLLDELLAALDSRYKMVLYEKHQQLDSDYVSRLYRYDTWSEYRDSNGIFEGKIVNVTDTGRLQIEDRRGRIYEYGFKELEFI